MNMLFKQYSRALLRMPQQVKEPKRKRKPPFKPYRPAPPRRSRYAPHIVKAMDRL